MKKLIFIALMLVGFMVQAQKKQLSNDWYNTNKYIIDNNVKITYKDKPVDLTKVDNKQSSIIKSARKKGNSHEVTITNECTFVYNPEVLYNINTFKGTIRRVRVLSSKRNPTTLFIDIN